jgi:hypothetical protein
MEMLDKMKSVVMNLNLVRIDPVENDVNVGSELLGDFVKSYLILDKPSNYVDEDVLQKLSLDFVLDTALDFVRNMSMNVDVLGVMSSIHLIHIHRHLINDNLLFGRLSTASMLNQHLKKKKINIGLSPRSKDLPETTTNNFFDLSPLSVVSVELGAEFIIDFLSSLVNGTNGIFKDVVNDLCLDF